MRELRQSVGAKQAIRRAWAGLAALAIGLSAPASRAQSAPAHLDPSAPILEKYCFKCHSGEKPKGDTALDKLGRDFSDKAARDTWRGVMEQLEAGTMPPEEKPQPSKEEKRALADWIHGRMDDAELARRAADGRVVQRRLNRVEYENTLRDLLGVEVNIQDLLPLDSSFGGFDNIGEALHTSPFLLERYLEAANEALDLAIASTTEPVPIKKHYRLTEARQVNATKERVFRKREDGTLIMLASSEWQTVALNEFYPAERGRYRFRIAASALDSGGKPITFRVLSGGGGMGGAKPHLIDYFDAPSGAPAEIEFIDYMEPRTTISILPYGLATAHTVNNNNVGGDTYQGPGLAIHWIKVEGPLYDSWPPASHQRIFGDLRLGRGLFSGDPNKVEAMSRKPAADAEQILTRFARRAFRREVPPAELQPYLELVKAKLAEKRPFEQAVRVGLGAMLISPEFLFLREAPGPLSDFALASRLSYFFWSSMPDDELLALAGQGKLLEPQVLRAQAERLLAHPKARAFAGNFTGQWLGLRDIDFTKPSHILHPEFDEMLKISMVREAELFFAELLKSDLSITNFVDADFSILNGRLAQHYGIPGIDGWKFQKAALPPGSPRGGVMTMAAVLKVTANGTQTSPVMRGAWVLDRILGTPPLPPPANIPSLEPDIRGATTVREQLAKHRANPSCASCHREIDPPGFALESFDVVGGWRDHYRVTGNGKPVLIGGRRMPYLQGPKVDPSDALPDGRAFKDIQEFKRLLLSQEDQIARNLAAKLAAYATGGVTERADNPALKAIIEQAGGSRCGLRSLVLAIVGSELFRNK